MNLKNAAITLCVLAFAAGPCPLLAQDSPSGAQPKENARPDREIAVSGHRLQTPSEEWQEWLSRWREDVSAWSKENQPDAPIPPIESYYFPTPETVCFPDERVIVPDASVAPWNANCLLIITLQNGSRAIGTGWMIGPKLVVTAGHCVHEGRGGRFHKQVEIIPGANGAFRPFGTQVSSDLRASQLWKSEGSLPEDYGAIVLSTPFRSSGGSPSIHTTLVATDEQLLGSELTVAGYPADKPWATQWRDSDPISQAQPESLRYFVDTHPGESGSPVVLSGSVVGIHNYGGCPNLATRITASVQAQLADWLRQSNTSP